MLAEHTRGTPVYFQVSIYEALENAEHIGQRFFAQRSRKGGKARTTDSLQLLIEEIVERCPSITAHQLLCELQSQQHFGVIQDIDDETICFTNCGDRFKTAALTGLKDRLSRAKIKLRSR